jgi:hypothetical protein
LRHASGREPPGPCLRFGEGHFGRRDFEDRSPADLVKTPCILATRRSVNGTPHAVLQAFSPCGIAAPRLYFYTFRATNRDM